MSGKAFLRPVRPEDKNSWAFVVLSGVGGALEAELLGPALCDASITANIFKTAKF